MTLVQDKRKDRCTCKFDLWFGERKVNSLCPRHGKCNHLDKDGDIDAVLMGCQHDFAWWECRKCGETLPEDEYNLESASSEWLEQEAEKAELRAG